MKGMEHVPFLIDPLQVHDDPLPDSDEPGESWQYIFDWDAKDYYIITEFLEHGELVTLIERLNETAQDQLRDDLSPKLTFIPNRLLWRIFLCLLRGVIAMAWPNAAEDWRKEVIDQDETITDEALDAMLEETPIREFVGFAGAQQDIAHFDIDVYNSKDPNDEEHKFIRAVPPLPGDADKKTYEDATFTYPSGEKIVVPETFAHFLGDDEEPTPSGSYVKWPMFARFDVDLRYTVAALMSRSLDIRGTLDLLYLTITGQIEEGDERARQRQVPAWETDAALQKFVDDHLRNAPEKEFVAEQALLEPTPRFGDRVAEAGIQFGELRFGALNFGGR
ncbi:kinase-like domain-containing protein [Apiospora sp. TS-2023a]